LKTTPNQKENTMSRPIRSFVSMLGLLSRGRLIEKLDEAMAETLAALKVHPSNKAKAKITLEVAFEYNDGRIEIVPSVKSKLPEEKGLGGTPLWEADGGVSTQHPSQLDLLGPRDAALREAI
jgi:hypothetical protein